MVSPSIRDWSEREGCRLEWSAPITTNPDIDPVPCYSTYRPLDAIEIATTRRELDNPQGPQLLPANEVVSLDAAVKAATMGPAYQLGIESEVGSIAIGKLADLIVLDRNLFETPSQETHKAKVLMTLMNGQVKHECPD
jgi:predicted amidohydrolase YtcJ